MPGPNSGGSIGGGPATGGTTGGTTSLNIGKLKHIAEIQPGNLLIVETAAGTHVIDFKNFMIGKPNIKFAAELAALGVKLTNTTTQTDKLTAMLIGGTGHLLVQSLSSLGPLTAIGGIRLGQTGYIQNISNFYTFSNPVSTTLNFHSSGGNSHQWSTTYSTVYTTSAEWVNARTTLNANSAHWNQTYTDVNSLSFNWQDAMTTVKSSSASWGGGSSKFTDGGDVTYLTSTSDKLAIGKNTGDKKLTVAGDISASYVLHSSGGNSWQWESAFTTVNATSGTWGGGGGGDGVKAQSTFTTVSASSADWNYTATNSAVGVSFGIVNNGTSAYRFTGGGFTADDNPVIHIQRGHTYKFRVNASGHPFYLKTTPGTGTGNQYTDGVTNNGAAQGDVDFVVQQDAPSLIYYQCSVHSGMNGRIYIGRSTYPDVGTTVATNSADWSYTATNSGVSGFKTIETPGQSYILAARNDTLSLSAMGGFEIHHHASSNRIILSGGVSSGAGATQAFKTISTSGQTDVLADSPTDTLTLSAMGNFEIHHHAASDRIILSGGSGGGAANVAFKTISTSGQTDILADAATDTLNLSGAGDMTVLHHAGTDTVILSSASERLSQEIVQSNSFSAGNILYIKSDGDYAKARSNADATADVVGVVESASSTKFTIVYGGHLIKSSHGLTVGAAIFLSDSTPGLMTVTEPTATDSISKPIGIVKDANTIILQTYRGIVIEGITSSDLSEVAAASADWNYTASNSGVSGFKVVTTSGQSNLYAGRNDTLTLSSMGGFEIQHHASSNTLILSGGPSAAGGGSVSYAFKTISSSGQADVVADSATDTLTLSGAGDMTVLHHTGTDTIILSSGGERVSQKIIQSNSFSGGDILYIKSDGDYDKAKANVASTSDVVGIVESASSTEFTIVYSGQLVKSSHGFAVGSALFLSESTAGALTTTEPTDPGTLSKPVGVTKDANTIIIQSYRGIQVSPGGGGGGGYSFKTVELSAGAGAAIGGNVVADSGTDTIILSAGPNIALISDPSTDTISISAQASGGGGGHTILSDGSSLTQRGSLNFISSGGTDSIKVEDNGSTTTNITIPNSFDLMMLSEIFR